MQSDWKLEASKVATPVVRAEKPVAGKSTAKLACGSGAKVRMNERLLMAVKLNIPSFFE